MEDGAEARSARIVRMATQQRRILWGALTTSTVVIAGVSLVVAPAPAPPPALAPILAAVALGSAIASFVVPARLFAVALGRLDLPCVEVPLAGSEGDGYRVPNPTVRRFAKPAEAARRVLLVGQAPFILGMALGEAVAILGLMLRVTGHPEPWSLPFFLVSVALAASRFPTHARIFGRAEARFGATFDDPTR